MGEGQGQREKEEEGERVKKVWQSGSLAISLSCCWSSE